MKRFLTLLLILVTVCSYAAMRGGAQYDPDAARSNLSNVDATATPSMTSITLSDKIRAAWADILGDIYASGTVKVSTGTAAAPAYSFSSDPNTGLYSPAADTVAVSVAGTEALRVNSAGEMLIATSTDAGNYPLQNNGYLWSRGYDLPRNTRMGWISKDDTFTLNGVDTAQNGFTFGPTAGDYVTSAGYFGLNFATQGAERMRITNGGNVLINTSTDDGANKLQVNGSMRLIGGSAPTATEGAIYYNSSDKHFYGYNGTTWKQLDN